MPMYYLDENREPRECRGCQDCRDPLDDAWVKPAPVRCDGTGRLGEEGAEPNVKIKQTLRDDCTCADCNFDTPGIHPGAHCITGKWWWSLTTDPTRQTHGPYLTEAEALAAAREAAGLANLESGLRKLANNLTCPLCQHPHCGPAARTCHCGCPAPAAARAAAKQS